VECGAIQSGQLCWSNRTQAGNEMPADESSGPSDHDQTVPCRSTHHDTPNVPYAAVKRRQLSLDQAVPHRTPLRPPGATRRHFFAAARSIAGRQKLNPKPSSDSANVEVAAMTSIGVSSYAPAPED